MKPDWRPKFFELLRVRPDISKAARGAGITRQAVYERAKRDPEFKAALEEILHASVDAVEAKCFELANAGNERLIMFILSAHKRETYGKQAQEIKHSGSITVTPDSLLDRMRAQLPADQYAIYERAFLAESTPALGDGDTLEAEYRVEDEESLDNP